MAEAAGRQSGFVHAPVQYDIDGGSTLPSSRQGLSTAAIRTEGSIMLVKEEGFSGVAENPRSRMDTLIGLGGGGKKGPPPVNLRDGDTFKKISSPALTEPRLAGAAMPELGRNPGQDGTTLIAAPVAYKIFTNPADWLAFTESRGLSSVAHDFLASELLILVSVSDFPSGIFRISGVESGVKETIVRYRVDPLAMADGVDPAVSKTYARVPVPKKGPPIRLEQIP